MSISEPFIRRPIGTSLLAFGLLLFGALAYHFLPIAPLPSVDFPIISVSASEPGVDPATAASSLAAPLERRFAQIAGVNEITSTSSLGGASIAIQFDLNRDINGAARDVEAAINAAAGELPTGLPNPPTYRKQNPADAPIMVLAMTSDTHELTEVFTLADQIISQRIAQVEGVAQVTVGGGAKSAVRVQVNPVALASMGLSIEDIRTQLSMLNVNSPKGMLSGPERDYVIASNDQLMHAADYQPIIVAQHNGVAVPLHDIGKAIDAQENDLQAGLFNGKRAVLLVIFKQPGANVVSTTDQVRALLPQLREWLPPGVKLDVMNDRTGTIRASVRDVQITLMIAMGLVVVVMYIFLRRLWPTVIAGIAMPLSLTGTFGVMWLCGYSLDNLSLMALTVSTGFVVDDAIVVIENIVRFLEKGDSPLEAALKGARQIGFTVVSMSISLVAVFIPLLFMSGYVGRMFHEFAVTLSVAILVSGVVSLTVTPMLCSRFLRNEHPDKKHGRFVQISESFVEWMQGFYKKTLKWVLNREYIMLIATGVVIVVTVYLYRIAPLGLFPPQDTGQLNGTSDAGQDISFQAMEGKQAELVKIVMDDPAVQAVGSFFGGGNGQPVNHARMFVSLKPMGFGKNHRRDDPATIINRLRPKLSKVAGAYLYLQASTDVRAGGRQSKSPYIYALTDQDSDELNTWAPKLLDRLQKEPKLKDVNTDQQFSGLQENVVIDRDAAARLGIQPSVVDSTLNSAFGQRQVSIMYTQLNQFHVILEVDPNYQRDPSTLDKIYVKSGTGTQVPLSTIAHFELGNTPLSIQHQGQFACVNISFDTAEGVSLSQALEIIEKDRAELGMPSGIRGNTAGTLQVAQASFASMGLLIVAAVIAVYIVLGMLYESLVHPITILSTIPSAGLGALLALKYTSKITSIFTGAPDIPYNLDLVSMIGIILLIGIVKKNAIMMVDFALEAERHEGLSPEEAIYQACLVRFRPIMMTTLAALFGAVPLAVGLGTGSELRKPLGISIIGGLIVSQMLTLYSTPVIYLGMEKMRLWFRRRRRARAARREASLPQPMPLPAS